MSINAAFRSIFGADMDLITDDEPPIQSLIDINNRAREMSVRRLNGTEIVNPESVAATFPEALSPRRLNQ